MKLLRKFKKQDITEAKSSAMLMLIAVICAVAAWFVVTMSFYASDTKLISNVSLNPKDDIVGTSAAANGLSVINSSVDHVTVKLDCSRTDYSRINADTLRAYVDFENITTAGKHTLSIKVESKNGIDISNTDITPNVVEVELDKFETKTLNPIAKIPNMTPADGKVIGDTIACTPDEITIKGPAAQLAAITECWAVSDQTKTLDSSINITSDRYVLLTEDGTEKEAKDITFDPAYVNMEIKVLSQATVPIVPKFTSKSNPDFDASVLEGRYTMTPSEITIASGSKDANLPPIEVPIDVDVIDIGFSNDYNIDSQLSPNNIINQSGISTVNFALNSDGLSSREFTLTNNDIPLLHVPNDGYDYSIVNQVITLKIVGPSDVINELTAADLEAKVNMLGADTSMIQFPYDLTVSCKTHSNVWSVNTQKVNIKKELKEGATTKASATSNSTTNTY